MGNLPQARTLREQSLGIGERWFAPCNPYSAILVNDLAISFEDEGEYSEARRLYRKAAAMLDDCAALDAGALLRHRRRGDWDHRSLRSETDHAHAPRQRGAVEHFRGDDADDGVDGAWNGLAVSARGVDYGCTGNPTGPGPAGPFPPP